MTCPRTWSFVTVAAAFAVLAGCGATPAATPTGAATPALTPAITAAPSANATASDPQPLRMGKLPAGEYETNNFVPRLVFTLPDGWSQFFPDEYDQIYMGSRDAELAISRAAKVVDPVNHKPADAPEDLAAWLTEHPAFGNPQAVAIRLGDLDAYYVDLAGPVRDTDIFSFPGGNFHIRPGLATRVYVVPQDGPDISFVVLPSEGQGATIDAAIEASHSIVESLTLPV